MNLRDKVENASNVSKEIAEVAAALAPTLSISLKSEMDKGVALFVNDSDDWEMLPIYMLLCHLGGSDVGQSAKEWLEVEAVIAEDYEVHGWSSISRIMFENLPAQIRDDEFKYYLLESSEIFGEAHHESMHRALIKSAVPIEHAGVRFAQALKGGNVATDYGETGFEYESGHCIRPRDTREITKQQYDEFKKLGLFPEWSQDLLASLEDEQIVEYLKAA